MSSTQEQVPAEAMDAEPPAPAPRVLGLRTFGEFLIGRREAILGLAACPQALWIGLLLVLSAGFAREYDGEDLLHEPWYLIIPLAASLVTSYLLFVMCVDAKIDGLARYRNFLTLYWLTAPLAWLYAIPVERMYSADRAVELNLWLLTLVALWRVALITRVLSVLLRAGALPIFVIVMLFADSVMLILLGIMPRPVFAMMGGVRLSDGERIILQTSLLAGFLGIVTFPIWFASALWLWNHPADGEIWAIPRGVRNRVSAPVWMIACVAVLGWSVVLPFVQPEQQLRRQVEREMAAGGIAPGLDLMSQHAPADFPPHWEPPPHIGYGRNQPQLFDVLDMLESHPAADWVRDLYWDKFRREAINLRNHDPRVFLGKLEQLQRYQQYIERMPASERDAEEWKAVKSSLANAIDQRQKEAESKGEGVRLPPAQQPLVDERVLEKP
jgi:hypothetical protein